MRASLLGSLSSVALAARIRDPVEASQILPPSGFASTQQSGSTTSNAGQQLDAMTLVGAPSAHDGGDAFTLAAGGRVYQAAAPPSEPAGSVTAQAVVDGMDLQSCSTQVRFTNQQYTSFDAALSGISAQVHQAKMKLDAIDIVANHIEADEANFNSELTRLQELYNTLAVRANALGKWMSDEKSVRDNLQELYREMVGKNGDEESRLVLLSSNMKTALQRLNSIETEVSTTMSLIASAQTAMYGWAANVTVSVNTHTTKLASLTQALQYRVAQIDQFVPEMRNVAKRTQYIARSLSETNLAFAAAQVLNQVESVLDTSNTGSAIMSVPSSM